MKEKEPQALNEQTDNFLMFCRSFFFFFPGGELPEDDDDDEKGGRLAGEMSRSR